MKTKGTENGSRLRSFTNAFHALLLRRRAVGLSALIVIAMASATVLTARMSRAEAPGAYPIDFVIVLDDSGSMRDRTDPIYGFVKGNDPQLLRYSAARMLIQLADDEDRVAVIHYGGKSENLVGDGKLVSIGAQENRDALASKLNAPKDLGGTSIDFALKNAGQILLSDTVNSRLQYIIFLTDGEPQRVIGYTKDITPTAIYADQIPDIQSTVAALQKARITVLPIFLCGDVKDCDGNDVPGVLRLMNEIVHPVGDANKLVREFGSIFSQIKPNLHVIDEGNARGGKFLTAEYQDVRTLTIVTTRDAQLNLKVKRAGKSSQEIIEAHDVATEDTNISMHVADGALPEGEWLAETGDNANRFVVVRTGTYIDVDYPPTSKGPYGPRFVPPGRAFVTARIFGPAGNQPILLGDNAELIRLDDERRWYLLPASGTKILQVGHSTQQLRIQRTVNIVEQPGLPTAEISNTITACVPNNPCAVSAGYSDATVSILNGIAYVVDITDEKDAKSQRIPISCVGAWCTSADGGTTFIPVEGHRYEILYLFQAITSNGKVFGDYATTKLDMPAALRIVGLSNPLNLTDGAFPAQIVVGTSKDLGKLSARVSLKDQGGQDVTEKVKIIFPDTSVPPPGPHKVTMNVSGLSGLKAGAYSGQIEFMVSNPDPQVRLPDPIQITVIRELETAELQIKDLYLDRVPYDAELSRIDLTETLKVKFSHQSFALSLDSSDPNFVFVLDNKWQNAGGNVFTASLNIHSNQISKPSTYKGTLRVSPADVTNHAVRPETPMQWTIVVDRIQLAVREGSLADFGDVGLASEEGKAEIAVRYTGRASPFPAVKLVAVEATGSDGTKLTEQMVLLSVKEAKPIPGNAEWFSVTLAIKPIKDLPVPIFQPVIYTGLLKFQVYGQEAQVQMQLRQQYWIWRYPWAFCPICGIPFVIWIVVGRIGDQDEEQDEEQDDEGDTED